jgi:hypothetical protein
MELIHKRMIDLSRLLAVQQSGKAVQQSGSVLINSDYIANNSSEVAPESTNQVQESQEILTYSDDKAIIPEHMPLEKPLSGPENEQHTDWMQHSIVSFMRRPQLIGNYVWNKNVARGNLIGSTDPATGSLDFTIPRKLLNTMILSKLDGFTSFRATAVIKLQINSVPFQQGRCILAAIPMPQLIAPRDEYLIKHPTYLQSINHIQIDISKQTEVSLRIPFVSPFNSFNLIENVFEWARVVAMVYSPLKDPSDGVASIPIKVWGFFEDVELGAPTSGIYSTPDAPDVFKAVQQAGAVRRVNKNITEPNSSAVKITQAVESQGNLGTLDMIGNGVQNVYNTIGDNIPFLKPVTNIFSTLSSFGTGLVGGVLKFLGFCKPQVGYSGSSVLTRPCEYYGNANGIDHSHVLSLDRMNKVDFYPGLGGTACDEMSFDFLKKIPQFVDWFDFSTSTNSGDVLFNSWVTPSYYAPGYLRIIGPAIPSDIPNGPLCPNFYRELKELQPTVLNYACSSFMYWTGSLVYTFRFVKTDFHSGRVEISFHPFTNYVGDNRYDYVYRLVVDLRENTEVSVSIPYISPQPWKAFLAKDPLTQVGAGGWADYGPCSTGKLTVRALTPLVRSNTVVESSIECLVEVRAGDDFKVQAPCRSGYFPFFPRQGLLAKQQSGPYALPGTSETRTAAVEGLVPDSITQGAVDIHRVDTRMLCSGEVFENFRDLTKRFCFVEKYLTFDYKKGVLSRSAPFYLRSPTMSVRTFIHGTGSSAVGFNQFTIERNVTPLSFVSALYAFYRGGIRLKVFTSNKDIKLVSARVLDVTDLPNSSAPTPGQPFANVRRVCSFMAPAAFELIQQKGFAEFQMPFYSPVYISIPWDENRLSLFDQSSARMEIAFSKESEAETAAVYISVAAADDMTFHGFIGVPPVVSLGRINDFYRVGEDVTSDISYINTTAMDTDPTYPIEIFTPQGGGYWGEFVGEGAIFIQNLQACISKTILNPCDLGDLRCHYQTASFTAQKSRMEDIFPANWS